MSAFFRRLRVPQSRKAAIFGCASLTLATVLAASFGIWHYWQARRAMQAYVESLELYEPPPPAPNERLVRLDHAFGVVGPQQPCMHTFQITNDTDQPWTVDGIFSPCTCTVPRLSAKTVGPGETLSVEVSYRPPGVAGHDTRRVQLRFAEKDAPAIHLYISAETRFPLSASLTRIDFGEASSASAPAHAFEVMNYSGADWGRIDLAASTPWLSAQAAPAAPSRKADGQPPRQAWTVTVNAKTAGLRSGRHDGSITITAGDPAIQPKTISVTLTVASPVMAIPSQIFYGEVDPAVPAGRRILLRFTPGCAPKNRAEITVTHDLGPALDVRCEPGPENCWTVTATLHCREGSAPAAKEYLAGRLTVRFKNENFPPLEIPLSAQIRRKSP